MNEKLELTPQQKKRNVKTTPMQKKAVDNLIEGKFKTKKAAMLDANYSLASATQPQHALFERRGVYEHRTFPEAPEWAQAVAQS